ncbi:Rv1476 family membrane protein [Nocardia sp. CA-290969]|uniref:Rv1476 family membrane protein n=1 Tax=Nocardia sp. CA-290969 TaxID=3239986 RepID=UPI003D90742A
MMTVTHTSAFALKATKLPDGFDADTMQEVRTDLADNGVAAPDGDDQSELAAIVAGAREKGIDLSIVVMHGNPGHDSELRDLATDVAGFRHGTVAVFSDDWIGTTSDSISRVRLEWAEDKAKFKGGDSEEAAQILVHRLEQTPAVGWTEITLVLLAGLVLAIGGLYWVKARRDAEPAAPDAPAGERVREPAAH